MEESSCLVFLLLVVVSIIIGSSSAITHPQDYTALNSLRDSWKNLPPNWVGPDPCGDRWEGIGCASSRVKSITLASTRIQGQLSGDISALTELQILDLSGNPGLTGSLPSSIGNLKKLTNLVLLGCGLTGPIPDAIGSLDQLVHLSLNSNGFSGQIPPSIGNLAHLYWLDLADNQLHGTLPVSNSTSSGLDMLVNTKHFHLGKNKFSGQIPSQIFSANMTLIHLLFDSNELQGPIPSTLGLVKTLEVLRFDNNSLTGNVPSNLNNLTSLQDLYLSNNKLNGSLPNLAGMSSLNTLDLSNNSFDASEMPTWVSSLPSITTLRLERTQLEGEVPADILTLPNLQTVGLNGNALNGTLVVGPEFSNQLSLIDLQNNNISQFNQTGGFNIDIILIGNPICNDTGTTESYCLPPESNSTSLYTTPAATNCGVPSTCSSSDEVFSPTCRCTYPFTGVFFFRGLHFSDLANSTSYIALENSLMQFYQSTQLPVDSVSLSFPRMDPSNYFLLNVTVFPYGQDRFNRTAVSTIALAFTNQIYKPPPKYFGPYFFRSDEYAHFSGEAANSKKSGTGVIIGAAVGGSLLVLLLVLAGVYAYCQKKKAVKAKSETNPFATWDVNKSSGSIPHLKGARCFSYEEVKKSTNNFSEINELGSGGYGKVYSGTLPTGELVAIKRAQQGSMQGGTEFKTEIELLSRVHHKNVVSLLGFCFARGEQMLIYEFVPNGSVHDTLSGKSGIKLDWTRRLKIALGAARGLAYLHELADPPIIHRDIKSANILLDERLNAKVADFGLSKLMSDFEKTHVTTQVKGTMGYLDPEYYMTQQLTEKSDVYSFGVTMLELATGKRPIERGKYIVREVRTVMDTTKDLYSLTPVLDPAILDASAPLKGLERFVDLALACVEESGVDRPAMGQVVKEIENIMQLAGMNPNAESAAPSSTYSEPILMHPYGGSSARQSLS